MGAGVLTDQLEECHTQFAPCANDGCDWKFGSWGEDVFVQRCLDHHYVDKAEAFDIQRTVHAKLIDLRVRRRTRSGMWKTAARRPLCQSTPSRSLRSTSSAWVRSCSPSTRFDGFSAL